jgi:hypothetical protein
LESLKIPPFSFSIYKFPKKQLAFVAIPAKSNKIKQKVQNQTKLPKNKKFLSVYKFSLKLSQTIKDRKKCKLFLFSFAAYLLSPV